MDERSSEKSAGMTSARSQRPGTPDVATTLGALLRRPYELLARRIYEEVGARFDGIRRAHGSVFRNISLDGSRITELAERAGMTKQSMAYLVDSLHENGYVTFAPDPDDGRAKLVKLTGRGEDALNALLEASRRAEADAARHLGGDGLRELRALLSRLSESLSTQGVGGDAPR